MKKLIFIALTTISLLLTKPSAAMQAAPTVLTRHSLHVTFNEPLPLIRRLVNYAIPKLAKTTIKTAILIATTEESSFTATTAITPLEKCDPQVKRFVGKYEAPYVGLIIFDAKFHRLPYGFKKACIFHEFCHIEQYSVASQTHITMNPTKYPKGPDQEADAWALQHLNCYHCALDFIEGHCNEQDDHYLTRSEALAIAETIDHTKMCDYHRIFFERLGEEPTDRHTLAVIHAMHNIEEKIANGELEP